MSLNNAVPETDSAREQFRQRALAATPRWYNPYLHLAMPTIFGFGIIGICLALLRDLRPLELLAVPLTFLFSNASEWRIHRDMLHKRHPLAPLLYERHTPLHHRIYVTQDMAIHDRREFRLVLLPAWAIVLILLGLAPIGGIFWALGLPNVALLFVATDLAYTLMYEWLHLSYHLPLDSFIGRQPLIGRLRRHHGTHHDPRLMQRWNFNVSIPLWDWVRGTIWKGQAAEQPVLAAAAPVGETASSTQN